MADERIYLDNAATSWPKPPPVYEAVDHFMRDVGAPAGRSAYKHAMQSSRIVQQSRSALARFFGAGDPNRFIFTLNGTDSLNMAIHGALRRGDHVITSTVEHNSVLRPLRFLEQNQGVQVTRLPCDGDGFVSPSDFINAITASTRMIALTHASNVTGNIQPISDVGRIARDHDILFLVDAAQTAGHIAIDVSTLPISLLAAPGHKGLLGPLGCGILYIAPGVEDRIHSVRQGGTGSESEDDRQPIALPDKFESGNLNLPAIAGLGEAINELTRLGLDRVRRHEQELTESLASQLMEMRGITLFGAKDNRRRVGVVSIAVEGWDPHDVAASLDVSNNIQVRSGLHCAPWMHRAMGTLSAGGTVRFSVGNFNTSWHIDVTVGAIAHLLPVEHD